MNRQGNLYQFDSYRIVEDVEVVVNYYENLDEVGLHRHNFIEVAFVEAGHGWHVLNGIPMLARPGELFVINHGDVHYYIADLGSTLYIYNLIFRPGFFGAALIDSQSFADVVDHFLPHMFRADGFNRPLCCLFEGAEYQVARRLFQDMLREYQNHEPGFEELIRSWAAEALVYLLRKLHLGKNLPLEKRAARNHMLDAILEHLRKNYAKPIVLEQLAMMAFLSPKYFCNIFKEYTGMTLTKYIQNIRVKRACAMMEAGAASLSGVARAVGYADYKSFIKAFKRITGSAPSEYRKALQRKGDVGSLPKQIPAWPSAKSKN